MKAQLGPILSVTVARLNESVLRARASAPSSKRGVELLRARPGNVRILDKDTASRQRTLRRWGSG